ncbi:MAG: nicotinamide-nucleotide amidohydrolase family protein [Firmicutes bacterium]|nr:nicotinamide-nucleotide amidohydrolase family protein [Bacillota bacterium]
MAIHSTILKLTGLSESQVRERLQEISMPIDCTVSYVTVPGAVHVQLAVSAGSKSDAALAVEETAERITAALDDYVFARDDEQLNETVAALLTKRGLTMAAAESCTGGLIMKWLTDLPGSSRYFVGGVVSYSNEMKINLLGVPAQVLDSYGAVSEQTARAMAEGICRVTGASLGLGVTGIAGPDGATPGKPVGLVFIALAAGDRVWCKGHIFPGQRGGVRAGAANTALHMARRFLSAAGANKSIDTNRK